MSQSRGWEQLTQYELERCYASMDLTLKETLPMMTKQEWLEKIRSLPSCPENPPLTLSYLYPLPKHRLQIYCQSYEVDMEHWTRDHMLLFLMNRLGLDYQELKWWKMSKIELKQLLQSKEECESNLSTKSYIIHRLWKYHRFQDNPSLDHDLERTTEEVQKLVFQWMYPI